MTITRWVAKRPRQIPGQEFVVLESLATIVKSDLTWDLNDLDGSETSDDVPF